MLLRKIIAWIVTRFYPETEDEYYWWHAWHTPHLIFNLCRPRDRAEEIIIHKPLREIPLRLRYKRRSSVPMDTHVLQALWQASEIHDIECGCGHWVRLTGAVGHLDFVEE